MSVAFFWLFLNILSIIILAFFSMMEMACVSFSKIRLQYYVSQGDSRAEKLSWLLRNSSRLFGTTLIGVNVAMMFGSEFSRQFYEAFGINPTWAALTQVIIVIIFGELAPMFAARKYSEHVSMLGARILYFTAVLMKPLLWIISAITHCVHFFSGGKSETFNLYLNQEEIRKILEEHHEDQPETGSIEELNAIVSNIFNLRMKTASKIMHPLQSAPMLPSNAPIKKMRHLMLNFSHNFVLVYHRDPMNIIGIASPRDLLREADNRRIGDFSKNPWFISKSMEVVHILHEFRSNKQSVAIVLNRKGKAIGFLTLQDVLEEIFGAGTESLEAKAAASAPIIERTFSGSMKVKEFNELFGTSLEAEEEEETLAELLIRSAGHHPEVGETIRIPPFEIEVKEATLLEIKQVTIKTKLS